ncbi:MAG TPA: hypothetical protein VNY05_46560, partial [Candidatus Acidoferrales bacterium]|nr:hypothetical protein [Candidatus Acidoferrales bacterium]
CGGLAIRLSHLDEHFQGRRKRLLPHRAGGLTIRRRLTICPTSKAPAWRGSIPERNLAGSLTAKLFSKAIFGLSYYQ